MTVWWRPCGGDRVVEDRVDLVSKKGKQADGWVSPHMEASGFPLEAIR